MRIILLGVGTSAALLFAGLGPLAGAAAAPSRSPAQPAAFAVCAACHTVSSDGAHSMGPNLRGIVGKKAASRAGYAYSGALKRSNIVWTRDKLDMWLTSPGRMVPGTRMVQATPNPADRRAIIDYLSALR